MRIKFESGSPKLMAHLRAMETKVEPAATAMSLNRTVNHVITVSRKEVAAHFAIPMKHIRRRFALKKRDKATARRRVAHLWVGLWELPVTNLTPKPRQFKSGKVKYKTEPGKSIDPHAFVAQGKKGKTAFARKGRPRLPIKGKTLNVGPVLARKTWMNLGPPARRFFEKTFFSQMEGRVVNEFRKLGMKAE